MSGRLVRLNRQIHEIVLVTHLKIGFSSRVMSLSSSFPQSHYFQLGRIDKDQVEDYSNARDESIDENEIWLAPVLGY